ncbi:MAG: hypothetical protein WC758_08590 [Candidatus Woesearchaeota archaeon]|jgi:hypothetical protein
MKEKVIKIIMILDTKVSTLVPNPKTKKIFYIAIGSLFGFMFLIIILGLILSPFRNQKQETGTTLNKPNIIVSSPKPQIELSDTEKVILDLETKIKELKFPESILNIPQIERNLSI